VPVLNRTIGTLSIVQSFTFDQEITYIASDVPKAEPTLPRKKPGSMTDEVE